MSIRINGNALAQKHAQFLVLHLQRLANAPKSDPLVARAANYVLHQLMSTYPELRRVGDRDAFAEVK